MSDKVSYYQCVSVCVCVGGGGGGGGGRGRCTTRVHLNLSVDEISKCMSVIHVQLD